MLAQMDALNVGPLRSSQFKKPFTTTSDGTLNLTANVTDTTCVISGGLQYITDVTNIGIPLGAYRRATFAPQSQPEQWRRVQHGRLLQLPVQMHGHQKVCFAISLCVPAWP